MLLPHQAVGSGWCFPASPAGMEHQDTHTRHCVKQGGNKTLPGYQEPQKSESCPTARQTVSFTRDCTTVTSTRPVDKGHWYTYVKSPHQVCSGWTDPHPQSLIIPLHVALLRHHKGNAPELQEQQTLADGESGKALSSAERREAQNPKRDVPSRASQGYLTPALSEKHADQLHCKKPWKGPVLPCSLQAPAQEQKRRSRK